MVRRIALILAVIAAGGWLTAATINAQHVEVGVAGGYTLAEGISVDQREILGLFYDKAEVNSGGSLNISGGAFVTPNVLLEFMYGRHSSKLTAEGGVNKTDVSDLDVDTYHGNVVYHWGASDAKVRPFFFGGLGATHYNFGDIHLPGATLSVEDDTQFSTTWGGGVKVYMSPNVGVKFTARWTPTYIKSDTAGYWCDPFFGCWVVPDPDYSNQFELSGGVTFKF